MLDLYPDSCPTALSEVPQSEHTVRAAIICHFVSPVYCPNFLKTGVYNPPGFVFVNI